MTTTYLIYKHTHIETGKSYIGLTNNIKNRSIAHKNPSSGCTAFRNAVQKYGWDQFIHEIIEINLTLDEANLKEQYYITQFNTLSPNGYNLNSGGKHYILSAEVADKISRANKGKPKPTRTQQHKDNMSIAKTGIPLSDSHKSSISESLIGKPKTDQHKENMSKSMKGRVSSRKDKPCSDTHKQNLSKASKGKPKSNEHKIAMSLSRIGRKWKIDPITHKRVYYCPDK